MVMMSYYPESDPHHTSGSTGVGGVGNGGGGYEKSGTEDDGFPVPSVWRMSLFCLFIF